MKAIVSKRGSRTLLRPAPMEGHGRYNRSSQVQAGGLSPAVPLFERAAEMVQLPAADRAVVLADYGASEGHNSLAPIGAAIKVLRGRTQQAISVVHTDLPENDFPGLFDMLEEDQNSYLANDPMVFASAVGRSFYEPILPPGSVTLGWTSWAIHWMSRIPKAEVPDHVHWSLSRDTAARQVYRAQGAADWRRFLECRSAELAVGGRMVVLSMASTDEGDFGYGPLLEAIWLSIQELATAGLLNGREACRMAVPSIGRTRAEFTAPFSNAGRFAGLSLDVLEQFEGEDHLWDKLQRDGDQQAFGAAWASFVRASVFPTFVAELDGGHDDPRATEFMDRAEQGIVKRMAERPERMMIPLARMMITKIR